MLSGLAGFALALLPIVLTPGASFTLVASHVLTSQRVVRRVVVGTALGIVCHASLAALGLSMIVMRSAEVYRLVQLAGAAYLIVLGILSLRGSRSRSPAPEPSTRRAFLANLLNPKAAAVYLTIAPQFMDSFSAVTLLAFAGVHIAVMTAWLATSGTTLRSLGRRFRLPWRAITRTGGVVLIALGLKSLHGTPQP